MNETVKSIFTPDQSFNMADIAQAQNTNRVSASVPACAARKEPSFCCNDLISAKQSNFSLYSSLIYR
jgi:hypothetical protein